MIFNMKEGDFMEEEMNYNDISQILGQIPNNFKILEETIDIEIQKQYYESSKDLVIEPETDSVENLKEILYKTEADNNQIKNTLQKLAMIDAVEAFRAIENFSQTANDALRPWSILALQQSRMIMHSSLLDEQQVFISTGLGGKNDKLRYFIIFPFRNKQLINEIQKNSLKQELDYFLKRNNSEMEEISFEDNYATATALIPLKAPVSDIIGNTIDECNQLGDYLSEDVIITNIKIFNNNEITDIIKNHEQQKD